MRISKGQARENHDRIVAVASEMFRARGFEEVAVGEVMRAAGFTHGGFYNHFDSKEALAAEALNATWTQMAAERARAGDLERLLPAGLSQAARRAPGKTCPAPSLAGDVARLPEPVRAVFADGLEAMVASVEKSLSAGDDPSRRERAINLVARMVGALIPSRAAPDDHPLSQELLDATLGGALREAAHD